LDEVEVAGHGLALWFVPFTISIVVDLPIFLGVFGMTLRNYTADIALAYLAFPAITMGIAAAKSPRTTSLDSY
jgi:hypothetical protein